MAVNADTMETTWRSMARMWRRRWFTVILCLAAAGFSANLSESPAEAAFLKDGVRPGSGRIKTLKPPRQGARKRLFRPDERRAPTAPRRGGRRGQQHSWFWKQHSPAAQAAAPARWNQALETMVARRSKGQALVDADVLDAIDAAYRTQISRAATRHNISPALLAAVIAVESRGQPGAVSPKGAQGLMQLIPATAKRFGVTNSFDTAQNIQGGAAYMDWLLREFRGDVLLALAGYNAGEGAVRKHKGVPPFAETRDYVVKVMDAVAAAQKLCAAPVSGPRDTCTPVAR